MLWACLFGLALALTNAVALAQASVEAPRAAERPRVRVRVVGPLAHDAVLKRRIASWFDPARFVVSVEGASYLEPEQVLSPEHGSLVEAWVTRRGEKLTRLYFASVDPDTRKTRYLLRDLLLGAGLDEVGSEALAQAVHLSTLALLEGQVASSREQVEQSLQDEPASFQAYDAATTRATDVSATPAPVAAPSGRSPVAAEGRNVASRRPRESLGYDLMGAVGYGIDYRGDEGWAHGPRARLRVGQGAWGGTLRGGFVVPHERQLTDLSLNLTGGTVLVAASLRRHLTASVALEGFAGPSVSLIRYRASARSGVDFAPRPAATELRPQLIFGAIVAIGAVPRVALIPEVAFELGDTHYDLQRGARREVVARAERLQPGLGLELEL